VRKEVRLPAGVRWVEPNDPEGLCGYTAALLFDNVELARKAITAQIGIGGLAGGGVQGMRDWHVYWYWEHILEQKTATSEGCPFKCPHVKVAPKYSADMCQKTRDIMMRAGLIGLSPKDSPEYISSMAKKLSEDLAKVLK
jgi:hypothetical protein